MRTASRELRDRVLVTAPAKCGVVIDQERPAIIVYLVAGGAVRLKGRMRIESVVVQVAMRRVTLGAGLVGRVAQQTSRIHNCTEVGILKMRAPSGVAGDTGDLGGRFGHG